MRRWMGTLSFALCAASLLLVSACGGGGGGGSGVSSSGGSSSGGTPTGANVTTITVDQGPNNDSVNTAFVSVTVCAAGSTSNCTTVDHVQLDTGSYGLRILSTALGSTTLQPLAAPGGGSLVECVNFVDGYSFGPVVSADVTVGGETANALPVQIIGDSRFATVPSDCSGTGTAEDTVATFHANGVLGVGPFVYDCGDACASAPQTAAYYACNGASCIASSAPLASQVQSFVAKLATDNNGIIMQLPTVADAGALTVTGSLIFGIDTESNNASGTETVIALDNQAELTATFNSQTLSQSFIDSGTNGIYFNDSSIPKCTQTGVTDFYCPTSTQALSAVLSSNVTTAPAVSATADFSVGNASDMFTANPSFNAFPELAGSYPGTTPTLDLGLTFFYGRRVAVALEQVTTTVGSGPYIAF